MREVILFQDEHIQLIPYKVHDSFSWVWRWWFKRHNMTPPSTPAVQIKKRFYSLKVGEWEGEYANCLLRKRVNVVFVEGEYVPAFLKDEKKRPELIDSDIRRAFRSQIHDNHEVSKNKFSKFAKLIISIFVIIMAVGLVIAAIAIIGKVSQDQLAILKGGVDAANSGWVSDITDKVLGG